MRYCTFSLGALLFILSSGIAHSKVMPENKSLDSHLGQGNPVVVKFFATWCPACRSIEAYYEKLSEKDKYKDIKFINVDVDKASGLANKYNIRGIPVFVFYDAQGEKKYRLDGANKDKLKAKLNKLAEQKEMPAKKIKMAPRKAAGAVEADAGSGAGVILIESKDDFEKYLNKGKPALVKFSADWCGPCKQLKGPYKEMAQANPSILFLEVDIDKARGLASEHNVNRIPRFQIYDNSGNKTDDFLGGNIDFLKLKIRGVKNPKERVRTESYTKKEFKQMKQKEKALKQPAAQQPPVSQPKIATQPKQPVQPKPTPTPQKRIEKAQVQPQPVRRKSRTFSPQPELIDIEPSSGQTRRGGRAIKGRRR